MKVKLSLEEFLNKNFGLNVKDKDLFASAFTHPSYKGSHSNFKGDYENLEFLGDSVIGLVVTTELFKLNKSLKVISNLKKQIINGSSLAYSGRKLDLHRYIKVGNSCSLINDSIVEDVYEAFIGAIYYEFGFDIAKDVVISSLWSDFLNNELDLWFDYKTKLNELVYKKYKEKAVYSVVDTFSSTDGLTTFKVSVSWGKGFSSMGVGTKLKKAEQAAARSALNTHFSK